MLLIFVLFDERISTLSKFKNDLQHKDLISSSNIFEWMSLWVFSTICSFFNETDDNQIRNHLVLFFSKAFKRLTSFPIINHKMQLTDWLKCNSRIYQGKIMYLQYFKVFFSLIHKQNINTSVINSVHIFCPTYWPQL